MNVVITCMSVYVHFTCMLIHDIVINIIGTTTDKTTIYMECDRSITSDDSKLTSLPGCKNSLYNFMYMYSIIHMYMYSIIHMYIHVQARIQGGVMGGS